jgi:5-oxoprolinase (ATP-hydrolysing) subunit A
VIDLNVDAGESFGPWPMGDDAGVFPHVTSVNLACGFHAGDPSVMLAAARLALQHGLAIGAHPGLPDLVGFGRRAMRVTADQAYADVLYQIGALAGILAPLGGTIHHVKLHGAFNTDTAEDPAVADAVIRACIDYQPDLPLVVIPNSELARAAANSPIRAIEEGFPERGYGANGRLAPRGTAGATIHDPATAAERAVLMASGETFAAVDGTPVTIRPRTLCIHGDNPNAAAIAAAVREALERSGTTIATF